MVATILNILRKFYVILQGLNKDFGNLKTFDTYQLEIVVISF